ncbi:MAG: FAD-dependent oxidoreductase [Candidatus Pacebacteria bacterium]|nr:FAD-dependent oxidoreductase [Candidatus Paceibacterota bacterium]
MEQIYDNIILGTGPAGMSAGVYAVQYKINSLIIGKEPGGMMVYAHKVENFPSYLGIPGFELIQKFLDHVNQLNVPISFEEVVKIEKKDDIFNIYTFSGKIFKAKTILLTLGTSRRKLNIKNEDKLIGKGVHYCAICDANFYKDKDVCVVGSGDAASNASLLLSKIANKVYQIIRGDVLKGETELHEQLKNNPKINLIFNNEIEEFVGEEKLEKVILKNEFNNQKEIQLQGAFIEIGGIPNTSLLKELNISSDNHGFIIVDEFMRTNIPGI